VAQGTQERQVNRDIDRVRADIERVREDLGGTLDQLTDRASPRAMVQRRTARVGARFRSVRNSVMGSAQSAGSAAGGSAHRIADQAGSAASTVADQARHAPDFVERETRGNPLAAGIIAFGAGLLVSTLLPPTEAERQAAGALQDKLEPVKERALEMGRELTSDMQDAAREGMEHVKETASDAAQQVKQDAQSAGEQVKEQAQQGASQVRDQGSGPGAIA
jgi:hypothetical protein